MRRLGRPALALLLLATSCTPGSQPASVPPLVPPREAREESFEVLTRAIYEELIEIDTSSAHGTTRAAEAMAARFRRAGLADVSVVGTNRAKMNVVARLRGTGRRRPLLLLAHLDVVDARREDWSVDPWKLVEKDGYYYGRGTSDDKAQAAIWAATVIQLRREGFVPDRDLVVALTADEEGGGDNGVAWLLAHRKDLVDAAYCLNEGGSGEIKNGKYVVNELNASEKVYFTLALEAEDKGGHSSQPGKENAIYRLAAALTRVAAHEFPIALSDVTRGYFTKLAGLEAGALADDMRALGGATPDPSAARRVADASTFYNAMLRTTCVATMLQGGHAENALPQSAKATVNCRVLPGERLEDVEAQIVASVADPKVRVVRVNNPAASPPSPLVPELVLAVEKLTSAMWPGVLVVPMMQAGASDGKYLRPAGIPTYGVSGLFGDVDDSREHGRDERVGVKQFGEARVFMYRLVKALAGG